MSYKVRVAITYAIFICIAIFVVTLSASFFAGKLYESHTAFSINQKNELIVDSVSSLYDPETSSFDVSAIQAIGMSYVHEGFIITVKDADGNMVWNAWDCDMEQCQSVLNEIAEANHGEDESSDYKLNKEVYPIYNSNQVVGSVEIETYGPTFYTSNEAHFIRTLSILFVIIGIAFALISAVISWILAKKVTKPIAKATEVAEKIADGDWTVRLPNNGYAKELNELADSLNGIAIALQEGQEWQKRLTRDVAHEIRTPLTALQGNLEGMIDGVWEPTTERLEKCHSETIRLNILIDDLKQLSLLEREGVSLQMESGDLNDLLQTVVTNFKIQAEQKGLRLNLVADEAPIYADMTRLSQVFVNVVSNSIKYTDTGEVNIFVSEHAGDYIVKVEDTGIGIAEDDLPKIFNRLYRTDESRDRSTGGSGIGLSIVEKIVIAHKGKIDVRSELGRGTIFIISLPKNLS